MRQTLRKILRSCVLCKRLQAIHFKQAPIASLPKVRVTECDPFTTVGVDLSGSFNVKISKNIIKKCYIVLFTCAVYRAVHLELVFDNGVESFLLAFRRFINRRGKPCILYSDNALNFKGASEYIKYLHTLPSIKDFLLKNSIVWRFNPARSSNYGGFFERLIGICKLHLKRTLQNSLITFDEFNTVLTEVENTMNTRPLTYVGDDLHEEEILAPSIFYMDIFFAQFLFLRKIWNLIHITILINSVRDIVIYLISYLSSNNVGKKTIFYTFVKL